MGNDENTTRFRPNLISEVAFSADGVGRPIHIFRTGTYTDMLGQTTSFDSSDIQAILANFQAGKRKRPPITERHDWGRAVGRIASVWADAAQENLYAQPNWNSAGRALLTEEVYDGFSCELDKVETGWTLIGGSLTNYPAVDGLEPVTLEAPGGAREPTQESIPMSEDTTPPEVIVPPAQVDATPSPPPDIGAILSAAIQGGQFTEAMTERFTAMFTQQMQSQIAYAQQQAEAAAARKIAEFQAQQQIQQYAQHATTPTLQRQYALPVEASAMTTFLFGLSPAQQSQARALFDRILDAGLVSFEEIGSAGDAGDEPTAKERFEAAVLTKVSAGMSRLAAMQAVGKEKPELYEEYQAESLTPKATPAARPAKKGAR